MTWTYGTCLLGALASAVCVGCDAAPQVIQAPVEDVAAPAPEVAAAKDPPLLSVTSPVRGAWFGAGEEVIVAGSVQATTAPVTGVSVSGTAASLSGTTFAFAAAVHPGVNPVGVRAEAEDGERTVDARAFFAGDTHPPGATIAQAVFVHLAPEFLDDQEPDQDDLAGIAQAMLVDPGFLSAFNSPIDTDLAVLTPDEVTIESASVDIEAFAGELSLTIALSGVHIAFTLDDKLVGSDDLSGPGTLDVETANLAAILELSTEGGAITAKATYVDLVTTGFTLEAQVFGDLPTTFGPVIQEYVESTLETKLGDLMGGFVAKVLDEFALDLSFGEVHPIALALALETVTVAPHGVNLVLSARVSSSIGDGVPFGPTSGSLATATTPPDDAFSEAPIAMAVDDDVLNQFLFALWYAGVFVRDFQAADLVAVDLTQFPEVFQPVSRIQVGMGLPMTLGPRLLDADDHLYDLAAGELSLRIETSTGKAFALSVNVRDGIKLGLDEAGVALAVGIDNRPKTMDLHVGCTEAPPAIDPGSVAALIRLGFPPLLAGAAKDFSFPVPGIDLGNLFSALAGKELVVQGLGLRTLAPEGHVLVIEGNPLLRAKAPPASP